MILAHTENYQKIFNISAFGEENYTLVGIIKTCYIITSLFYIGNLVLLFIGHLTTHLC